MPKVYCFQSAEDTAAIASVSFNAGVTLVSEIRPAFTYYRQFPMPDSIAVFLWV